MSKEMREQINKVKNWKQFLNENKETIPTENNSWQDHVEKINAKVNAGHIEDNTYFTKFHSYKYTREAAGEVLYEFAIGLKKFLEEKGITVFDNTWGEGPILPELTVNFSYYQDINKYNHDKDKNFVVCWKNDDEIYTTIIDYFLQHKDKVTRSHGIQNGHHTTIFFWDRRDIP